MVIQDIFFCECATLPRWTPFAVDLPVAVRTAVDLPVRTIRHGYSRSPYDSPWTSSSRCDPPRRRTILPVAVRAAVHLPVYRGPPRQPQTFPLPYDRPWTSPLAVRSPPLPYDP